MRTYVARTGECIECRIQGYMHILFDVLFSRVVEFTLS